MSQRDFIRGVEIELERLGVEEGQLTESAGRRAVLLASSEALWRRHLGDLYETDQVMRLLGITTRGAVSERSRSGGLLALPSSGRARTRFPAFQFSPTGEPYSEVRPVVRIFAESGLDGWTTASWFQTPQQTLEGTTPAEWMCERRSSERLLTAARMSAQTLAA